LLFVLPLFAFQGASEIKVPSQKENDEFQYVKATRRHVMLPIQPCHPVASAVSEAMRIEDFSQDIDGDSCCRRVGTCGLFLLCPPIPRGVSGRVLVGSVLEGWVWVC